MSDDVVTHPLEDGEFYIYGEDDIQDILADSYVDLREIVGDEAACECLDVIRTRLTDEFYNHE